MSWAACPLWQPCEPTVPALAAAGLDLGWTARAALAWSLLFRAVGLDIRERSPDD